MSNEEEVQRHPLGDVLAATEIRRSPAERGEAGPGRANSADELFPCGVQVGLLDGPRSRRLRTGAHVPRVPDVEVLPGRGSIVQADPQKLVATHDTIDDSLLVGGRVRRATCCNEN